MRIWDVEPEKLCRQHLLGEHRELHGVWCILTCGKRGYRNHPEVRRWEGKLKALWIRHGMLVSEMLRRGYDHKSPLEPSLATGKEIQDEYIDTVEEQREILREKGCNCKV